MFVVVFLSLSLCVCVHALVCAVNHRLVSVGGRTRMRPHSLPCVDMKCAHLVCRCVIPSLVCGCACVCVCLAS